MPTDNSKKDQGEKRSRKSNKEILDTVYENVSRKTIYAPDQISDVLKLLDMESYLIKTKGIELYNLPCSFDIETYSFYENDEKRALMYVWMLSLGGLCIVGRTWDQFEICIQTIVEELGLHEKKQLFLYVHNLSYEFQWICKRFTWSKIFALEERKPVYAMTDGGIVFRCSYLLSGYALATVAKHLQYKISKLDSLDYKLARNSQTELSPEEIIYCLNDVKIVVLYLAELLSTEWNLNTIPITKTGFVRRFCQTSCFKDQDNPKNPYKRKMYVELMQGLTLTSAEYNQLKRAFQGGFTHASAWFSGKEVNGPVKSMDETSAYPFMMVAYQFPMSAPEHVEIENRADFSKNLQLYCCCFDICFEGLEARTTFENYISESRCWVKEGYSSNNGRIVEAAKIWTTITEQDFFIIKKMYKWKKMKVANFMRFKRGYLPRDFVKAVLKLYEDKTTLKGVKGLEQEYQQKKELLNSCY